MVFSKQHVFRRGKTFTSPGKIGRFCGISIGKGIISASSSVRTCFFRMDREDIGAEATAREIAGDWFNEPLKIWEWRSWRSTDWDVMDVCTSCKIPSKRAICKFKSCNWSFVSWVKSVRPRVFTASSSESIWNGGVRNRWGVEVLCRTPHNGQQAFEPNAGRDERCCHRPKQQLGNSKATYPNISANPFSVKKKCVMEAH